MCQLIVFKQSDECWRIGCEQDRKDLFLQRVYILVEFVLMSS